MNAQLPITTTPKYNFPLPQEDLQLPQKFIELSLRSLKKPQDPPFPEDTTNQLFPSKYNRHGRPAAKLLKLESNPTKTPIAAIDVSSIKLGETETGILLAVRGAIVWKQADRYRYLRLGPFPFHITERNKNDICSLHRHFPTDRTTEYTTPNVVHMQTRLNTAFERWIQTAINKTMHNSLILWDSTLTAGTPETPLRVMEHLLKEARSRQNAILAFSKITRLLLYGHRITELVHSHPPPCLLKIENHPVYSGTLHLLGDMYVAKLTGGNCAFRLDIDRELSQTQTIEAVQKLLGNDLILQSYPETLRLAHIFSTFTANEVLGIQRYIAKEGNLKVVLRPNVRRLLFGRFGKGPEG